MRSIGSTFRRRSPRSFALGSVALIAVATLASCKADKGPGSIVVTFVLGNSKTCEEVGVTDIRATAFKGDFDNPTVLFSEEAPCVDGEVVLESVDPNTYELRVIGYDENGVATFDNLGQTAPARVVEVFDASESTIESDLTARPAELRVRWRLGTEGFGNCDGVGIARFEIAAYQTGGGTQLLSHVLDCDAPGDSLGYREIPDPNRELNGVLFGEVGVQALAADGSDVGTPALYVFDPVGPGYPVEVGIECTDAGCVLE